MNSWTRNRQALQDHLKNNDLADFINWSTIQATMFVGTQAPYIPYETLEITSFKNWQSIVEWTGFGADWFTSNDLAYRGDPNLVHQYYHLKQWLDLTRQDIREMESIVEVGAGYGAMALICHRLGFKGRYYIIDLPELITLQQYYLAEVNKVLWTNSLQQSYPFYLMDCDLFIGCHSLCEMPLEERERLLSQTAAKEYLFASSYEFDGVDNVVWFQRLAGGIQGIDWKFYPHRHQENTFYMVGVQL